MVCLIRDAIRRHRVEVMNITGLSCQIETLIAFRLNAVCDLIYSNIRVLSARRMLSEILNERHVAGLPALRNRQALPVARPGEVEDAARFEIGQPRGRFA